MKSPATSPAQYPPSGRTRQGSGVREPELTQGPHRDCPRTPACRLAYEPKLARILLGASVFAAQTMENLTVVVQSNSKDEDEMFRAEMRRPNLAKTGVDSGQLSAEGRVRHYPTS